MLRGSRSKYHGNTTNGDAAPSRPDDDLHVSAETC